MDDFDPADHLDAKRARRLDRFSQLSVASARMAAAHAGLAPRDRPAERTGVWIGSALGGVAFGEEQHAAYVARGVRAVSPTLATAVFGGAGACNVAIDLGSGTAIGNANSCASGHRHRPGVPRRPLRAWWTWRSPAERRRRWRR